MGQGGIGLFDSGVGGLTVARQVARLCPGERMVYLGDTAHMPYGNRPVPEIEELIDRCLLFLAGQQVDVVAVACNTSSAIGLSRARARFSFPIVGMIEPGADLAVRTSTRGRIGVMATVGTVETAAYARAIKEREPRAWVGEVPCQPLVRMVEDGLPDPEAAEAVIAEALHPLLGHIDTLVLGCTHFPVAAPIIQRVVGPDVRLVDPAVEVARHVSALKRRAVPGGSAFYTTGDPEAFARVGGAVYGSPLDHVQQVSLPVAADVRAVAAAEG